MFIVNNDAATLRVSQGTGTPKCGKQSRYFGNQQDAKRLHGAILGSRNWRQVCRKLGGAELAFAHLFRREEKLAPCAACECTGFALPLQRVAA